MFPKAKKSKKTIYLDYAATTPLDPQVKKAMEPFWSDKFGNPSSLYQKGREAALALENARKDVSKIIGARPEEIIFTAGGTESVNLAIFGVARNFFGKPCHLITTKIEHPAVLNSYKALEEEGFTTSYLKVDKYGFVNLDQLEAAILPETALISVMYANNEIGAIEPIAEIGNLLKKINLQRLKEGKPRVLFHTDACQAAGALELNVERLGVDLMTVNGSKIYGPKQIAFLYVKKGTVLKPLIYGGGQEGDLRSGTQNVPAIIGLAKALQLSHANRIKENQRLATLRNYFIKQVLKLVPLAQLNGPEVFSQSKVLKRLPNNINLTFPGIEGEALLLYLDTYGICVSTGSACSSSSFNPSHVLMAIGKTLKEARGTIRVTLGNIITKENLDYLLKILPSIILELRKVEPLA